MSERQTLKCSNCGNEYWLIEVTLNYGEHADGSESHDYTKLARVDIVCSECRYKL